MHSDGRLTVFSRREAIYVYMPANCSIKEGTYACRSASNMSSYLNLDDAASVSHTLHYVAFSRPYETLHLLTNYDYWLKEIKFWYRF